MIDGVDIGFEACKFCLEEVAVVVAVHVLLDLLALVGG